MNAYLLFSVCDNEKAGTDSSNLSPSLNQLKILQGNGNDNFMNIWCMIALSFFTWDDLTYRFSFCLMSQRLAGNSFASVPLSSVIVRIEDKRSILLSVSGKVLIRI